MLLLLLVDSSAVFEDTWLYTLSNPLVDVVQKIPHSAKKLVVSQNVCVCVDEDGDDGITTMQKTVMNIYMCLVQFKLQGSKSVM